MKYFLSIFVALFGILITLLAIPVVVVSMLLEIPAQMTDDFLNYRK